jgi:CubicO group peptidase (beta-lactamase class C family)
MKQVFFFLIASLLWQNPSLTAQALSAAATAEMDKLLQEHFKADGPGAAVLVSQKGKVLYHKSFGMANLELGVPLRTDHVFRIGSVTKQFTGAAILKLAEEGKLSLQDELTKFLPDYPTLGKKITVEHLLTHTSGIKSYTDLEKWTPQEHRKDFTTSELVDYFKNEPMDFDPDAQWNYNNSGYILLGCIIEKTSGKTYAEYIAEQFFKPLGMNNSYYGDTKPLIKNRAAGYSQNDVGGTYANADFLSMTQPYAAGSLLSTVEDLHTWTRALHSGKVLKPESVKKATTPYILPDGTNTHYGYGLSMKNLLGSLTVEHSGGIHGFLSDLVYLPKEEICVAILTNCDCEPPSDLSPRLAALVMEKPYQPTAISLDVKTLEQYIGVYENEKKEQRFITLENGQLHSRRKGGSKYKLHPYGPDQFYFEESFARLQFIREKKGDKKVLQASVSDRTAEGSIWAKTGQALPADRPEMQLTEAQTTPFLGEYALMPGFNIAFTREGTQMYCQATGQPRVELFASSPTRFFLKVVDGEIEFYPDEKGAVDRMVLFQGGREMEGKRVK